VAITGNPKSQKAVRSGPGGVGRREDMAPFNPAGIGLAKRIAVDYAESPASTPPSTRPALMQPPDKFEHLFALQHQLNLRIGLDTAALTEEQQVQWVLNYCRAASQELAELTDSVPWKWWAKYQTFDKANARVEVVDLFHFLISLAQVLGMSASDVHDLYLQKNKLNLQRQDTGYAVKNEDDNKGLQTGA
jgi:dimeric dUTPase (all-alpha-NTP-PPase superfamily)